MSQIVCPHCGVGLQFVPTLAGQPTRCGSCNQVFTMPQQAPPAAVAPAPTAQPMAPPAPAPFPSMTQVQGSTNVTVNVGNNQSKEGTSSWAVALLLCFFLGIFGAHRFYTGHILIGLIQLFTLGFFGLWTLLDFVLILLGAYRDVDGSRLRR